MNELKTKIIGYLTKGFFLIIPILMLISALTTNTGDLTKSGQIESNNILIQEKQEKILQAESEIRILQSDIANLEVKINEMGGEVKKKTLN